MWPPLERRYRSRILAGQAPDPPLVIFSRTFDIPWVAPLFEAAEQPVLIYTAVRGEIPDVAAPVEVVVLEPYTSAAALADLRVRGVRALLLSPLADAHALALGKRAVRDALAVIVTSYEFHGGFRLRTLSV